MWESSGMQALGRATGSPAEARPAPADGADQLAAHWEELSRFVLDRKMRSSLYRGPAGDLSHIQLAALTVLAQGDVRMGDLAARLGLAESSLTRLVDRLQTVGLADRHPAAGDRRCVEAGLTAEGRRVMRRVRAERREFLREILETLEPAERGELVRLFGVVAEALRARRTAPSGRSPGPTGRREVRP
ncbi:MAG: MarR family winged helix-turn-helix transcriptional regulator [Actinomycetota bacterium]|nr:MarR family winged helix-turn-helix transcriptional regulator [Actinomycetota bacterium]